MKLLVAALLVLPTIASAQVVITEVMYDLQEGSDSGREWIEVSNAGAAVVSLTNLVVVENGKKHAITAVSKGEALAPGAYAIIADNATKFRADYPAYAGLLFDSAFSLNNTGETIGIANASDALVDSITYTNANANGTGDSLQRAPGSLQFAAGIPTPGSGIPAGGLVRSPPPAPKVSSKSSKKTTAKNLPLPVEKPTLVGDETSSAPEVLVATAAAAEDPTHSLWWLAPILLAFLALIGIVWSRDARKGEWDIVEEIEETG